MNKKNVLIFFGGLGLGACGGIFGTGLYFKKKFEEIANEEIESIRQYYYERSLYAENPLKNIDENREEFDQINEESRENGPLSDEGRAKIKEQLDRNRAWAEKQSTNYAAIYEEKHHEVDPAEEEFPTEEETTEDMKELEDLQEGFMKQDPELLSPEEAGNLEPGTESQTLFFYTYDETLTDEDDEVIEEPGLLLGNDIWDALVNEGNNEKIDDIINYDEDPIIFVINHTLNTCYEIQIVDASFEAKDYGEDE